MKKLNASWLFTFSLASMVAIVVMLTQTISFSQGLNNQTNVYIPSGLAVYTDGNVINGGFIQNNGAFSFTGNWNNTAIYQGSGIISLEGQDQLIANNNQPIEQIVIDGGGTKTISSKVIIISEIDFNDGIILVSDNDTLLLSDNCKVIGGSSLSYVDGALTTTGTGYRFYPIGKNGFYHPAELPDIKGITPVLAMEVEQNLPAVPTTPSSTVMQDIYWTRKTISGSFESSTITLQYALSDTINQERVAIAQATDLAGPFSLIENVSIQSSGNTDVVGSRKETTGNIFAIAELLNDPSGPYYLSTTLSPNAVNPENRSIKLFGDAMSTEGFSFQVFNRWGILVYETQSMAAMKSTGWDGKQHGSMVSSGAYPYSLKYRDSSGTTVQKTGFIIVLQ